ncbi:nuclear transport factor 2 family protein [Aurantiacibacter zhengii]|uniref:Nuclear transport factor 2 family protein n=1 Tax=Aurantiacibacter zhengii TaxID=2307003 RepID=A0A418NUJ0_9SPHN|nr:nuclear transport factor 2 family protein [Aurantiacibacter zhengii]
MFSWLTKSRLQTARAFVEAMNGRDFAQIKNYLADDVRFIDSSGRELQSADKCLELFHRLLATAPDLQIEIGAIAERGNDILISGRSKTSTAELRGASQWRAKVEGGKIIEWQMYSNRLTPSLILLLMKDES